MPLSFLPPRFSRDARGTIAVVTAIVAVFVLICAGAAIDYIRLVRTRTDLQAALDSATLAAAAKTGPLDQTAPRYAAFNGSAPQVTVKAVSFSKRSDGTVEGALTAEIPSSFLRVAGFGQLTLRVTSAARGVAPEAGPTKLTLTLIGGDGPYDKEFYVVVKDNKGQPVRETKLFDYDFTCLCHSSGPTFSPAKGSTVTVALAAGETAAYKLVVYRDPVKRGARFYPGNLQSDDARAQAFLKLSGQCSERGGQTQNWEDGLATTFQSLVVNVTCVMSASGAPRVVLVR